jgi:hypothetical protein
MRPDQWEIARHPAKVKIICMGRRWGKTMMAGAITLAAANAGNSVAWIAPTYKNTRPLWRFAEAAATPLVPAGVKINKTEREIAFPGGGMLSIYSADNIAGILGNAFHLVVIDEAARVSEEAWQDAIQPTLADYAGDALLISTPKGRNWFWREWQRGREDGAIFASWQAPTTANPSPNIKTAAAQARERVPERTYRQEWLAEFIADGSFFPNVEACATAEPAEYRRNGDYVIGADWARASGGDYTVFAVVNAVTRSMVHMERMQGMDFDTQRRRLASLADRYRVRTIIAEYNSIGGPQVEALQSAGLPVVGFNTSAASKHEIISGLELALDRREITLLSDPVLIGELQAYERIERAGLPGYSAPPGMHDDTVMALALAWHGASADRRGGFSVRY